MVGLNYTKNSIQDRSCWARLPRRIEDYPPPPCGLDGDVRALARWVAGIGPIPTSDIRDAYAEVIRMLDHNAGATYDDARWVAIDGPSHAGKTYTIIAVMLRINDDLLSQATLSRVEGELVEHIPVIYVGDQGASSRGLVGSIAAAAGLFATRSESEADILRRLRMRLPRLGCILIVVDEAHMLRRVGAGRDLTDNLRRILSLPVSFVFTGAGLRDSALYRRTDITRVPNPEKNMGRSTNTNDGLLEHPEEAAMQLRNRMKAIRIRAFDGSVQKDVDAWSSRMHKLVTQIDQISGFDASEILTADFATQLFNFTQGRTGSSFLLIKDVCEAAILRRKNPTFEDLQTEIDKSMLTP